MQLQLVTGQAVGAALAHHKRWRACFDLHYSVLQVGLRRACPLQNLQNSLQTTRFSPYLQASGRIGLCRLEE